MIPLLLAGLLAIPFPAVAQEPPAPQPRGLDELLAAVQDEIRIYADTRAVPLPPDDLDAYLSYHLARLDLFIGSIRAQAHLAIDAEITDPDLHQAIWDLSGEATPNDVATALETVRVATAAQERFALQWVALYGAIDELRTITEGRRPVRVCPVQGETTFVDDFSEARPGGREHTGIDLNGKIGTPLQAVEDGVVVQANWHWLGGRQVWIRADATGDVYYYAHLDTWAKWIWTGTRVKPGDVIGTMGWSGDADASHLHFGWMPGSYDIDLDNLQDAYPLLLEICR